MNGFSRIVEMMSTCKLNLPMTNSEIMERELMHHYCYVVVRNVKCSDVSQLDKHIELYGIGTSICAGSVAPVFSHSVLHSSTSFLFKILYN